MTEDVLSHGDERPPRRYGSLLAGAAAVALLAIGVAGALRSPEGSPRAAPTPSASGSIGAGWTEYPPESPPPDPFAEVVVADLPQAQTAVPLLLGDGVPGLLVAEVRAGGTTLRAYAAIGGPAYAPVLLGWCQRNSTLQDVSGRYSYFEGLQTQAGLLALETYPVRMYAGEVQVAMRPGPVPPAEGGVDGAGDGCDADELTLPLMPPPSDDLFRPGATYAVMNGRYVVSVESRAFCPAAADAKCESAGWEQYGPHTVLPPGDLASSYTWEGAFLVRTHPLSGGIDVALTPSSRLVRRARVGTSVRVGWVESWEERDGTLRLAFNPFGSEGVPDDSPAGPPRPPLRGLVDQRGGLVRYTVRPDAEVYLGRGITGLGKPRGTPATLRQYLSGVDPYEGPPLWLVLDVRGRVMRAVLAPEGD